MKACVIYYEQYDKRYWLSSFRLDKDGTANTIIFDRHIKAAKKFYYPAVAKAVIRKLNIVSHYDYKIEPV